MLIIDRELDSCRSGITLNLWLGVTSFWSLCGPSRCSFKSQEIEKIELFSQGTDECQNLRYECLIIVDPKYIEISILALLNIKY